VIVIIIYCYRKRFSHSNNEKKKKQTVVNQVYTQGHNQTEVVKKSGQPTRHIIRPAEVPMAQVPGIDGPYQTNTAAPIAISDAGTIPPATATATMAAAPILQSGQDQMQHLQLSSHPRPRFIMSLGDNDQSNSRQYEVKSGPGPDQ
jgi:hypothetical protein